MVVGALVVAVSPSSAQAGGNSARGKVSSTSPKRAAKLSVRQRATARPRTVSKARGTNAFRRSVVRPRVVRPRVVRQPLKGKVVRSTRRGAKRLLTARESERFMTKVAKREARFFRDGVGYDHATGLTYDGHNIDFHTGELVGGPRNASASSKESLHINVLIKALEGDRTARLLLSPDAPHKAESVALEVLKNKIKSYERFNKDYPGYGGFLPWFKVEGGRLQPVSDWRNRVPGLDNGQLAWSLYVAANALHDAGHAALAKRYQGHVDLMKDNVVHMFYDPAEKALRAEVRMVAGNKVTPKKNKYQNNVKGYLLSDPYEGLLLNHFADLFGKWKGNSAAKESLWATPRRKPASYKTKSGEKITVAEGHWFSSHEDWGYMVLPLRDHALASNLFENGQRARTIHAAEHRNAGLFASVNGVVSGTTSPDYVSNLGIAQIGKLPVTKDKIYSPYATFPLALSKDKRLFATWLQHSISQPRMWGPYGMGESFSAKGDKFSPVLTWDGKVLPLVAYMGGTEASTRKYLTRDGLYKHFLTRDKADYKRFDGKQIHGTDLAPATPTADAPVSLKPFAKASAQ